eukprot:7201977-Prymnesium_polylepis.2
MAGARSALREADHTPAPRRAGGQAADGAGRLDCCPAGAPGRRARRRHQILAPRVAPASAAPGFPTLLGCCARRQRAGVHFLLPPAPLRRIRRPRARGPAMTQIQTADRHTVGAHVTDLSFAPSLRLQICRLHHPSVRRAA